MLRTWSCWSVVALLVASVGCATENVDALAGNGVAPEQPDEHATESAEETAAVAPPQESAPSVDEPTPPAPAPAMGETCELRQVPKAPYLKAGLHPRASDALAFVKVDAAHITQTIGNVAASAGTHAKDGTFEGHDYSAAVDLSVRDMNEKQVAGFIDQLTEVGFVAYYRKPGLDGWPSTEARHVHAIWVGAPMKLSLRNQVGDWRVGKNALASHTVYTYKTWSACWRDTISAEYRKANPAGT